MLKRSELYFRIRVSPDHAKIERDIIAKMEKLKTELLNMAIKGETEGIHGVAVNSLDVEIRVELGAYL